MTMYGCRKGNNKRKERTMTKFTKTQSEQSAGRYIAKTWLTWAYEMTSSCHNVTKLSTYLKDDNWVNGQVIDAELANTCVAFGFRPSKQGLKRIKQHAIFTASRMIQLDREKYSNMLKRLED